MNKLLITSIITISALPMAQEVSAEMLTTPSNSVERIAVDAEFDMNKTVRFTPSGQNAVYIYASKRDDNRVLIMDAKWSPFASITSEITETKAHAAGLQFATSEGFKVKLSNAKPYYYEGEFGYAFTYSELK